LKKNEVKKIDINPKSLWYWNLEESK